MAPRSRCRAQLRSRSPPARHYCAAPRLASERHLRHPAGERHTPRKAARAGWDRHAGEPWANLQRRGKDGDAERERLPAGEMVLCPL